MGGVSREVTFLRYDLGRLVHAPRFRGRNPPRAHLTDLLVVARRSQMILLLLHVVASALNNSTQCFVNGRHDHLPNGKPRAIASCRRNTLCRKECCSSCSTRHGIGLHHFVNRVRLEANQTVAVLAVGNSVARWDDYATARAFVESVNNHAMENHWATSVPLSYEPDGRHALGATEPER